MKSFLFLLLLSITGCNPEEDFIEHVPNESMYFPSNSGSVWETKSISSIGWNLSELSSLKDYLIQKNSKSFMILVNGRIVLEQWHYF
jgi:hypothetical protein